MTENQLKLSVKTVRKIIKSYGGQTRLAEALGCQPQAVWKWQSGFYPIPLKQAIKLVCIEKKDLSFLKKLRPDVLN